MEFDRAQLKRSAKQAMRHQRPHPMLITLLFSVLAGIGTQVVNGILGTASGSGALASMYTQALLQYEDPASAIQYVVLAFGPQRLALALSVGVFFSGLVTSLWAAFLRVGYANFCLDMARGHQPQTDALFSHFPQWAGVLLTKFLAGLFRGLWGLLLGAGELVFLIAATLLLDEMEILLVLVTFVSCLAFSLGLMWLTLRYAMVDFLIADQGLIGMDAIRESKRLVRENGNTGRLFILELSFINWYLVEAAFFLAAILAGVAMFGPEIEATMGTPSVLGPMIASVLGFIGLLALAMIAASIFNLWLTPYVTGAEALFYDWARGGSVIPPSGGFDGGQGGWSQPPYPPQQPTDYTRSSGPSSGTGIGSGSQNGGGAPRSPKPPRDDPWD